MFADLEPGQPMTVTVKNSDGSSQVIYATSAVDTPMSPGFTVGNKHVPYWVAGVGAGVLAVTVLGFILRR